jgi:hypothetical protein
MLRLLVMSSPGRSRDLFDPADSRSLRKCMVIRAR